MLTKVAQKDRGQKGRDDLCSYQKKWTNRPVPFVHISPSETQPFFFSVLTKKP